MVIVFLLTILISPFSQAREINNCIDLFTVRYGQLKTGFVSEHNNKYTVEIADQNPVKNQCSTSHCHLYAWTAELENMHGIEVSNHYLDMMRIYEKTIVALAKGSANIESELGAFSPESRNMIQRVGIMPAAAWTGNTDFIKEPMYSHLMAGLETIVARTLSIIKGEEDAAVIEAANNEAIKQIQDFIGNITEQTAMNFKYEGKTYNPVSFAKLFFPELYLPLIDVRMNTTLKKIKRFRAVEGVTRLEMNHDDAEALIRKVIDSGRPVYLTYNDQDQFIDTVSGIMTIDGFAYPPLAAVLNRTQFGTYAKWGGAHAVLVVGYDLDPVTNLVTKWKIKNSWGKNSDDKGYRHMYRDYFRMFAWGFNYAQDGNVTIPKKTLVKPKT